MASSLENSGIKAWIRSCGIDEKIHLSLEKQGISLERFDPALKSSPGILAIKKAEDSIFDFLREYCVKDLSRVLVIFESGSEVNSDITWKLLNAGASDVYIWKAESSAKNIFQKLKRWNQINMLIESDVVRNNLVCSNIRWKAALRGMIEVAHFTDAPVLITGESGTGKELVARLIHTLDKRQDKRNFILLDCTTVVPELSGSEFFGHERGAFTGAVSAREGAFSLADKGSLFLDEVGDLPATLQAELLRVVQEQTFKRVGSDSWRSTKFRLICATNRDLLQDQACGRFRSDLYYRITCWTFRLPPLRERPEDILPLARHFVRQYCKEDDPPELDDAVCEYLTRRTYHGNIRELKQLVQRIMSRHVGPGPVTPGDIPENDRPEQDPEDRFDDHALEQAVRRALSRGAGLKEIGRAAEDIAIRIAVNEENGSLQRASKKLGVTDRALQIRRSSRRFEKDFSS